MSGELTDAGTVSGRLLVDAENVWSCSEPDRNGRVVAVVRVGDALLQVEGRRIFSPPTSSDPKEECDG